MWIWIPALAVGVVFGTACVCLAPRRPSAYLWGLATLTSGCLPFFLSKWVLEIVVEQRSLILIEGSFH